MIPPRATPGDAAPPRDPGPGHQGPRQAAPARWASVPRWVAISGCLAVLGGAVLLITRPSLAPPYVARMQLVALAWVAFGVAAWLLRGISPRPAIGLILVAAVAFQAIAVTSRPAHSSDMYRYMWDGRVQAAGIDPYLYPPSAAGVAPLRNGFLWTADHQASRFPVYHYCIHDETSRTGPAFDQVAGCSKINRTNSPTIYPPVAEAWFLAVYLVAGDGGSLPMQVAMALCALATTLVLMLGLGRLGRDRRQAALWAWCPTAILETGNDAHVDVLAALLTVVALLVLARARTEGKAMLGGAILGLALSAKLTPIFVFPSVLKRAWQHILVAAAAATAVVYAPHLLAVGSKVIGFFPGYLHEQGYSNGSGYDLIALFVHGKLASLVAFGLLAVVGLAVLKYGNPDQPWRGAIVMTAAALVIGTPQFEWYSMLLVALVALDGRWEWLVLSAGGYLANDAVLTASKSVVVGNARVIGYGGGLLVALAITGLRYQPYRLLTGHRSVERGGPLHPSMEVCDTRTASTASTLRGTTRTTAAPAASGALPTATASTASVLPGRTRITAATAVPPPLILPSAILPPVALPSRAGRAAADRYATGLPATRPSATRPSGPAENSRPAPTASPLSGRSAAGSGTARQVPSASGPLTLTPAA